MHDNDREAARLENGRLLVFTRDGVYQARIRIAPNKYIYRTLKTFNRAQAIQAAQKLFYAVEFKQETGLPVVSRSFNSVIDEYVAFRTKQHAQGHTSIHMLRQIMRVVKFWREYAANLTIEGIGDVELRRYIEWRKDYYASRERVPQNAKLNPTDKTLQWEMMLGKAIIRFAHSRGYRGNQQLPTFSFTPKKNRVRPAFDLRDYRKLLRALVRWGRDSPNEKWRHTRLLLRDYVLILANSGMRVGEANNLKIRDVELFEDGKKRRNYRFKVNGKTGERDVILRASAAKSVDRLLARLGIENSDDWLFAMLDGSQVITLIDQFDKVLALGGIIRNGYGEKYSLYSLRHFYAVQSLRRGLAIFDVARNMGTSVGVIQSYYGKHATPLMLATQLGG